MERLKVLRIPAPDDFGFIVKDPVSGNLLGRCFCNPGGIFHSDFNGPGNPTTPIDLGEERIEYWFYDRERYLFPSGFISHTYVPKPCTAEEFGEKFDLGIELQKETHLNGKPTATTS